MKTASIVGDKRLRDTYFFNVSTGQRDNSTWRTEDGRVCLEFRKLPFGCTEFRIIGDALYLKRISTGEMVALQKP